MKVRPYGGTEVRPCVSQIQSTGLKPRATTLAGASRATTVIAAVAFGTALLCAGASTRAQQATSVPGALTAVPRPSIPSSPSEIWLVPDKPPKPDKATTDFARGVRLLQEAKYAEALPLLSAQALAGTPLAPYSAYYTGIAYFNLARAADARTVFAKLRAEKPAGFLSEGAALREAEAAVAQQDFGGAAKIYEELSRRRTAAPDAVLLALGRAQAASGDKVRAAETFARLYYEFPLSDLAATAETELDGLRDLRPARESPARFKLELGRAERLFGARRYALAHDGFQALRPLASGDEAELVALRIAECDHYLRRYRQTCDGLKPYLDSASRKAEARFFYLTALRELGEHDEFVQRSKALVAEFPESSWAEETLNNLATHYILEDQDDQADGAFRELYATFPKGAHAERAAWKAGWWAYKHERFQEAIAFFEGAASTFPRSDYRPAYLYWSSRAREASGDKAGAVALLRIVASDYLNSYYGRLAVKRLPPGTKVTAEKPRAAVAQVSAKTAVPAVAAAAEADVDVPQPTPPAADQQAGEAPVELIRLLVSLELYDAARDEILYAQRSGSDSPALNATLAWVYNRLGDYRRGIVLMKRAYPTYMSAEAAGLPNDLLKVIFPIDYWPLIKRYAPVNGLDPYVVAALINQESSFLADARSSANAIGLMQLLPSTGRRYARTLRLRRFSAGSLTRPEVNIQIGTAYFADLVQRLGGVHYALASYNAGPHRLTAWTAERPGLEREEFIDDIPFPETQAYVKKILGTADDYRRLYADGDGGTLHKAEATKATKSTVVAKSTKATRSTKSAASSARSTTTKPAKSKKVTRPAKTKS